MRLMTAIHLQYVLILTKMLSYNKAKHFNLTQTYNCSITVYVLHDSRETTIPKDYGTTYFKEANIQYFMQCGSLGSTWTWVF